MKSKYISKFDEINKFESYTKEDIKKLFNDAYDFLVDAYMLGWLYTEEQNKLKTMNTPSNIDSEVFLEIDGMDVFDRLEEAYNDQNSARIKLIMNTEYHRLFNEGSFVRALSSDLTTKRWTTMADDRVRETHDYLEGVSVPIDAEFITFDGDSAMCPGGFSKVDNNANCRCVLEFT